VDDREAELGGLLPVLTGEVGLHRDRFRGWSLASSSKRRVGGPPERCRQVDADGVSAAVRVPLEEDVADRLVAVLREALSNAARHARASKVDVEVSVDGTHAKLTVIDDGVGIPVKGRRSGLANLAERAQQLGGGFGTHPGVDRGTVLTWSVPLVQHDDEGALDS
jgi:signal transduction histidine kinase